MKIVVTGSLGNIGKPLTEDLVQKGHDVTVISSKQERTARIEALGAKAAIGTMQDVDFLTATFKGADIVYLMETLNDDSDFEQGLDIISAITQIGRNYKQAVLASGVKKIIHLSSIGGHTDTGNGMLRFHYNVENILKELPEDVHIKTLRPVGFYYNMFAFIHSIKRSGAIVSNYGGDVKEPWVAPVDIAAVIAEEVERSFNGRTIRYIASDEVAPNELTSIIGEAIGKPDLQWQVIPSEQFRAGLLAAGMNESFATGLTEMNEGRVSGTLYEDYNRHRALLTLSPTKIKDFVKDLAAAYHQK